MKTKKNRTTDDVKNIILRVSSVVIMSLSTEILKIATQYTVCNAYTVLALGIIGNAINILVFTQLKIFQGNRSAFYLIVESISNLLYEFVLLSLTILTSIYGDDAAGSFDI